MALPEVSKEINFKYSIRKFFYDLASSQTPSLPLLFDTGQKVPLDDESSAQPKWLSISFGNYIVGRLNEATIDVYCCARDDGGADEVTILRDLIVENFTDSDATDTIKRIPMYINIGTVDEEIIAWMIAEIAFQSPYLKATDGTQYKSLTINFRWGGVY